MRFPRTLYFLVLIACLALSGCKLPAASPTPVAPQYSAARTWIDAPLDGSTIPLAPYEIVIHAYDPAGVSQVELKVNGSLLAALPNPDPGQLLATLKTTWEPPAPGNYTLAARAVGPSGPAGYEVTAVVTVSGPSPTPVYTSSPTVTQHPTITLTATPTQHPTITLTPTSGPVTLSFTPQVSAYQFYYGSCTPNQVTIQVNVAGGDIYSVVLFLKLQDQASGTTTGWDSGTSMTPGGGGWFSRTVSSSSIDGAGDFNAAWLLYQFVATDSSGEVIGRSQTYSDIALSACSAPPFIRVISPTPTPTLSMGIIPPLRRVITPTNTLIPIVK
jgi:hypothetical protein